MFVSSRLLVCAAGRAVSVIDTTFFCHLPLGVKIYNVVWFPRNGWKASEVVTSGDAGIYFAAGMQLQRI